MSKFEWNSNELKQYSWLPQSSEEQLNLGLELINYAYTNHYTTLENDITTLTAKVKDLTTKLREANDKISESELILKDLAEKNNKLVEDNERLTINIRKLKVENTRLQNLTNNIRSTIDGSEAQQLACDPIETYGLNKISKEIPLETSDNRAQQLINQIEISLQQNPSSAKTIKSNHQREGTSSNRSSEYKMRYQYPKISIMGNQTSRIPNGSIDFSKIPYETYDKEIRSPINYMHTSRMNTLRPSEVEGSNPIMKNDRNNIQYEEGKSFFREARKMLPFDKFNSFIQEIKLLNKGQKSKEQIIKVAESLFIKENPKMLEIFKQMLQSSKGNGIISDKN